MKLWLFHKPWFLSNGVGFLLEADLRNVRANDKTLLMHSLGGIANESIAK